MQSDLTPRPGAVRLPEGAAARPPRRRAAAGDGARARRRVRVDALPATDADELQAWFTRGAETARPPPVPRHVRAHARRDADGRARSNGSPPRRRVDLAADGVVYAEVRFAPELHQRAGSPLTEIVEAVCDGFRRGEREAARGGPADRRQRDHLRDAHRAALDGDRPARRADARTSSRRSSRSTSPAPRPAGRRRSTPRRWPSPAQHHLNMTIHASEPPDLELISDALAHGAHRIGHGVRLGQAACSSTPDGDATARPARPVRPRPPDPPRAGADVQRPDRRRPDHRRPPDRSVPARSASASTVNTDNRLMSNVSPSSELHAVATTFDLSWDEVEQLVVERRRGRVRAATSCAAG